MTVILLVRLKIARKQPYLKYLLVITSFILKISPSSLLPHYHIVMWLHLPISQKMSKAVPAVICDKPGSYLAVYV